MCQISAPAGSIQPPQNTRHTQDGAAQHTAWSCAEHELTFHLQNGKFHTSYVMEHVVCFCRQQCSVFCAGNLYNPWHAKPRHTMHLVINGKVKAVTFLRVRKQLGLCFTVDVSNCCIRTNNSPRQFLKVVPWLRLSLRQLTVGTRV